MNNTDFKLSTHLSIAWGVMLAILTIIEWNSLGRDPMATQILSPFIERDITIYDPAQSVPRSVEFTEAVQQSALSNNASRLEVAFVFNGPLFLLCFFAPILIFRAMGWIATRLVAQRSPANRNQG